MKKLIFAGLLSLLFPHKVVAQPFQEVNYAPEKTVFSLFAPNDAKKVTLRIYQEGLGGKVLKTVKMQRTGNEQWTATVRGDLMGKFYTFDVGLGECAGVFAKAFPVLVEEKLPALRKIAFSGKKKDRLLDITEAFNSSNTDRPFENSGVMVDGIAYSTSTIPVCDEKPMTIRDIMVTPEEVPAEFYVPEAQIERWKYFKGAKRELRTRKDGGQYFYTEGGMDFPDSIDKPSRTIITSEGGKSPDRCRHVIRDQTGRLRRLVPVELERLNMFPSDHTKLAGVDNGKRAFLMGNALVCGIITRVGKELKARLKLHS